MREDFLGEGGPRQEELLMSFKQGEVSSVNMQMQANQQLNLSQRLIMSAHMQQALKLLQLPMMELEPFIEEQVIQNPILEITNESEQFELVPSETSGSGDEEREVTISEEDLSILGRLEDDWQDHFSSDTVPVKRSAEEEKLKAFRENSIYSQVSLQEHLIQQAHDSFETPRELEVAELLIGYIDSFGFLNNPLREIALLHGYEEQELAIVLKEIQTFEPYGIGGATVQESLLIQLKCLGKEGTLAWKIIKDYYEELLHNHLPIIMKKEGCTYAELHEVIEKEIAPLDLHPGTFFSNQPVQVIVPDVTIRQENEKLIVEVDRERLPALKLNRKYLKILRNPESSPETIQFLKRHLFSAKWLMRNLQQRYSTIERITTVLVEKQAKFFLDIEGELEPLTMKAVADELNLHESTIARTVANKYVNSPRGIFPLRSFFTNKYLTDSGEVLSSKTVKDAMMRILEGEDKCHPLSDAKISNLLKKEGITCARRTVAKYRLAYQIGNTQQRKKYR